MPIIIDREQCEKEGLVQSAQIKRIASIALVSRYGSSPTPTATCAASQFDDIQSRPCATRCCIGQRTGVVVFEGLSSLVEVGKRGSPARNGVGCTLLPQTGALSKTVGIASAT